MREGPRSEIAPCQGDELPRVLYVSDIAHLLGKTVKAVRNAVSRGTLPPFRKIGGRACWLRADMASLRAEICGGKPAANVKITAAPYSYDRSRMLVMFTIKLKGQPRQRVRKVAPAGLDKAAALAWGKGLEDEVLLESVGDRRKEEPATSSIIFAPAPIPPSFKPAAPTCPTLSDFWARFEAEYVSAQKPSTRRGYTCAWRHYFRPVLGDLPIDLIDRHAIAKLRKALGKLQPASRNQVLYKLRAVLDQAVTWGILEEAPRIKPDKEPKKPDPITYSEAQAELLIAAARSEGREHEAIVLLLLHGGLRVSEVCALRWSDVDLDRGIMTIRHNLSAGEESTPKGGVAAPVGLSPDLADAFRAIPRQGEHVLMRLLTQGRKSKGQRGDIVPHTAHSIRERLNTVQRIAGLEETGPHRLRHSCLTILANRGLDPWKLQAHARHARISTTRKYVHLAKEQAALDAAAMWAPTKPAKPAQTQPKKSKRPQIGAPLLN